MQLESFTGVLDDEQPIGLMPFNGALDDEASNAAQEPEASLPPMAADMPQMLSSAEVIRGGKRYPEQPKQERKFSVLQDEPAMAPVDNVSRAPVTPATRAAINAAFDADGAGGRAGLTKDAGYIGQIARQREAEFARLDESAAGQTDAATALDPRAEKRRQQLIKKGEDPRFAERAASEAARAGGAPGMEVQDLIRGSGTAQEVAALPSTTTEVATNAVMRGVHQFRSMGYGLAAAATQAVGAEDVSLDLLKKYMASEDAARKYPAAVQDFTHIKSLSDVPTYVLEAVLENAPQLVTSIGSGGVGAIVGKKVGEKAVAGMLEEQAKKLLARRIAQGTAVGAGASSIGMETGSIYGQVAERTGERRPGVALAFGTIAGALDAIPAMRAVGKIMGHEAVSLAMKDVLKRYPVEALKQLAEEGPTEFLQQWAENAATSYVDGRDLFTKDNLIAAIDAALKGAAAGAATGVAAQGIHDARNAGTIARENSPARALSALLDGTEIGAVDAPATAAVEGGTTRQAAEQRMAGIAQAQARLDAMRSGQQADATLAQTAQIRDAAQAQARQAKSESVTAIGQASTVDEAIVATQRAVDMDEQELSDWALQQAGIDPAALTTIEAQAQAQRQAAQEALTQEAVADGTQTQEAEQAGAGQQEARAAQARPADVEAGSGSAAATQPQAADDGIALAPTAAPLAPLDTQRAANHITTRAAAIARNLGESIMTGDLPGGRKAELLNAEADRLDRVATDQNRLPDIQSANRQAAGMLRIAAQEAAGQQAQRDEQQDWGIPEDASADPALDDLREQHTASTKALAGIKGGSLTKALRGSLSRSDWSDIGDLPMFYLGKGGRGADISSLVADGGLDEFLPPRMRHDAAMFDEQESAEYIKEAMRTKSYLTYDAQQEIERLGYVIAELEAAIDEILTLREANEQLQIAAEEQRRIDEDTRIFEPFDEEGADGGVDPALYGQEGAARREAPAQGLTAQPGDLLGDAPNASQQAAANERARRAQQEQAQRNAAPGAEGFALGVEDARNGREVDPNQRELLGQDAAPKGQGDGGRQRFTVSMPVFGDVPYRASAPVRADGRVLSSRVITSKTPISKSNARLLGLPEDKGAVYAWRVSVVQGQAGPYSIVEAMAQDHGRSTDGEVLAHFKPVDQEAVERVAPAIARATRADWQKAADRRDNDSFDGALTARENGAVYETDLFGDPVPAPARRAVRAQSTRTGLRGDVQPAAEIRDTQTPEGQYFVRTIVGHETQRRLGADLIRTPQDAAQATEYLYKSAVERFDAIVTDKGGKPLAVVGGFKGAVSQTSVYPGTVVGEAVRIPGAAHVWFSHNHPSGNSMLSRADENLMRVLSDAFRGSGIEPKGLMAVSNGKFSFLNAEGVAIDAAAIPSTKNTASTTVPVIERELAESGATMLIGDPEAALRIGREFHKQGGDGILLLNAQYAVAAWVPITGQMRGTLRHTGALNAIYRAISESNASAAILVHDGALNASHPDSRAVTVGNNIAAALAKVDVRPLDIVNVKTGKSLAQTGLPVAAGPMFSRRGTTLAVTTERGVVGNKDTGRPADDATQGAIDEDTGLPLNADGTVTVYHHTNAKAAAVIRRTGMLKADAEPDVYVTTRRETDTGYGDTAVAVRVNPARLQIDDEFPNGRKDFRLSVGRPGGSIRVAVSNEPSASADSDATRFSRSASTKADYEARIDALFAGGEAATGTRVLDRSDVMGMLGHPDMPLILDESHLVSEGLGAHPEMTAAQWKKVPEWIENPALAYKSRGRIVLVAPERVAGHPVLMVIDPEGHATGGRGQANVQLLVTAYAKTRGGVPFGEIEREKSLIYWNTQNAPAMRGSGGVQFSTRAYTELGRGRILTEKHLAGWRRANDTQQFVAASAKSGATVATIATAISQAYGKSTLNKLQAKGLVTLVQSEDEAVEVAAQARAKKTGGDVAQIKRSLTAAMQGGTALDVKRSASGSIQGFYDPQSGQSFLIADNLTAEAAPGVLVHEVGIHMAADTTSVRGKQAMDALVRRAETLRRMGRGNPFFDRVTQRMRDAGETSREETAAYMAEAYEQDRTNAPASVKRWVQDFMAAVRAWLFSKGVLIKASQLTPADIAAVARANVRRAADAMKTADQRTLERADDLRFSRQSATAAQGNMFPLQPFTLPEESLGGVRRKLQDSFIRALEVQNAVAEQGGVVNEATDFYLAEELSSGKRKALADDLREKEIRPLVERMAKLGVDMDELALYAYAMHAHERNARIASINPNFADGGSGMTNAEADAVLAQVKAEGREQAFAELHTALMDITQGTRRLMRDSGLITAQQYQAMQAQYQNYIPLRGFEAVEDDGRKTGMPAGRGINIRGSETVRALGRASRAGNLIETAIVDRLRAIDRSERNQVGKVFLNFVRHNPDPALWEIDATRTRQALDRQTGQVNRTTTIDKGEDTISVKVGGREVYIRINDPLLLRALRNTAKEERGELEMAMMRSVGLYSTLLRNTLTRWNPEFALTNAARDFGFGTAAIVDELGEAAGAKFMGYYAGAIGAAHRYEKGTGGQAGKRKKSEWDRYFNEFRMAGGMTAGFYVKGIDEVQKDVRAMLLDAGAKRARKELLTRNPAAMMLRKAGRVLEWSGSVSENAARVAAYRVAREAGKTPSQAASIAKNLTTNFDRKGEYGQALNALYVFYNAAVQGSHRMLKMLANPRMLGWMAGMGAAGVATAMLSASMGGDDPDDGMAYWDKIPDYVKERNFIIMLPPGVQMEGAEKVGTQGRYIKIPLQYGLNLPIAYGYVIGDVIRNQRDPNRGMNFKKAAVTLTSYFFGAFNPFDGSVDLSNKDSVILATLPSTFDFLYQQAAGVNGFGRPVAPYKSDFDHKPDSENYNLRQADSVALKVARWLNRSTGGNEAKPGGIDVSAGTIENLIRNLTGGTGTFIYDSVNLAWSAVDSATGGDPDVFVRDVPLARRVYGTLGGDVDQGLFYENRKQADEAFAAAKGQLKIGIQPDPEERAKAMMHKGGTNVTRTLAKIRREMIRVTEDKSLSAEQRTARLRELRVKRDQLTSTYNQRFHEAMGKFFTEQSSKKEAE